MQTTITTTGTINTNPNTNNNNNHNFALLTLESGGAVGADLHFAKYARLAKHRIRNWVFENQYVYTPLDLVRLTKDELETAEPALLEAAEALQRPINQPYQRNLLRRNYFQIRQSELVLVVSTLLQVDPNAEPQSSVLVDGGSAWACQMFANQYYKAHQNQLINDESVLQLPLYCFDQDRARWYRCSMHKRKGLLKWTEEATAPMLPTRGIYTGIGTRQLNDAGRRAIEALYLPNNA